jgi:hypothetical protein
LAAAAPSSPDVEPDWTWDIARNLERRRWLTDEATPAQKADMRAAFAADSVLWMRMTCWTFRPKVVDQEGREVPSKQRWWPLLPWPCQVRAIRTVEECIAAGVDVVVDKSRDMGASWVIGVALMAHRWLFQPNFLALLGSRVEDMVDKTGEPDSLFWKIDAIIEQQPRWLLPAAPEALRPGGKYRRDRLLANPVNGSVISGQAATPDFGRAGRKDVAFFDEHAAMEHGRAAWDSCGDTTACRISCSTQVMTPGYYSQLLNEGRERGVPRVVSLKYHDHPEKGRGAEERVDKDGSVTGIAGERFIWTPWLQQQIDRGRDRISLSLNVFNTAVAAGANFFATDRVSRAKQKHARPAQRGEVVRGRWVPQERGRLRLYEPLVLDSSWSRFRTFAFGMDPSYGVGSANACIVVLDVESMEQVAEFVDPHTGPTDLALIAVAMARGPFKGARLPMIAWERNGPGAGLQHEFDRAGYRALYRQQTSGTLHDHATLRVGWQSTKQTKRELLTDVGSAVTQERAKPRSEELFAEMLGYVVMADGSIDLASKADLTTDAREAHGDRVIALGCALLAAESGYAERPKAEKYPAGSYGAVTGMDELEDEDETR